MLTHILYLKYLSGVCNWAIPKGEVRRIKRLNVFLVTSAWAIFAYLWLYVILSVVTPGDLVFHVLISM